MDKRKDIAPEPQCERQPYTPPTAEIILLTPQENLAVTDFGFHQGKESFRWGLNGWADYTGLNQDPSSGTIKSVYWDIPTDIAPSPN